jgi:hypothetical protein
MVSLVKEAGIPAWGGRLVQQLQGALNGLSGSLMPLVVANLPAPTAALTGARRFVTDAMTTTFAATVAGGGTNPAPVYCDGAAWRIG